MPGDYTVMRSVPLPGAPAESIILWHPFGKFFFKYEAIADCPSHRIIGQQAGGELGQSVVFLPLLLS